MAAAILAGRQGLLVTPWSRSCVATAAAHTVTLDHEQAVNAATIAGVAVARGLPARAASIALTAAYQESDLRNLDHGDRDSLGLFQQRPSQGWGTPRQVLDPVYAANRFYDALVKVPGYGQMSITEAAQRVQRSAFPNAYADHEADARVLASVLTGWSPAGLTCSVAPPASAGPQPVGADGLTPGAARVRAAVTGVFGRMPSAGVAPGEVTSGHAAGSTHYEGRALDVFVGPAPSDAQNRRGWAVASWAVAHAQQLGIAVVIFDDRVWSATRSDEGWRPYRPADRPGDPDVLRRLDHVHIDVGAST